MGFIWVAVKAAFVCRQAGCVANLFTAEYTGTGAFTGTERARSCHRNRERQHAGVCLQACVHYNRLAHCSIDISSHLNFRGE
ncbi:hypothetical protein PO909_006356 [Leuciscus waleckii]